MKKPIIICITLSIILLSACSSPKKVKTEEASATPAGTEQATSDNNLKKYDASFIENHHG